MDAILRVRSSLNIHIKIKIKLPFNFRNLLEL